MKAFDSYEWSNTLDKELDRQFPTRLRAWTGERNFESPFDEAGTHFGYMHEGSQGGVLRSLELKQTFPIVPGMVFSHPGKFTIFGGRGIIITREDWHGYFQLCGQVEHEGRLKYIDGCTDSLLIAPPKVGDPCLNLLYFPPGIDQTAHTHPSDRIGIIMSGKGKCIHGPAHRETDLVPGMIFRIRTDGLHKFQTPYDDEMRVLAYHPDSDFGPADEAHPMLNRTIIDGVSAADEQRAQYRTQ